MDEQITDVNFESENKNKKVIIGIIIFVVLVLLAIWSGNKLKNSSDISYQSSENNQVDQGQSTVDSQKLSLCFYNAKKASGGLYDTIMLRVNVNGSDIDGEYSSYPAQKDSKIGLYKGTVSSPDVAGEYNATVWWSAVSEGTQKTEELMFNFSPTKATVLSGAHIDNGDGTFVYKDKTKLTSNTPLEQISCDSMTEKKTEMWITK